MCVQQAGAWPRPGAAHLHDPSISCTMQGPGISPQDALCTLMPEKPVSVSLSLLHVVVLFSAG